MTEIYAHSSTNTFVFIAVFLVIYLLILGMGIASYVLTSLSLYKIANRRQIANPWLAWLPFGNYWIIGSIADNYDERNGMKRKWRVVFLTLSLIILAGFVIFYIVLFVALFSLGLNSQYAEPATSEMIGFFVAIYAGMFVAVLPATALSVCNMICIYKIFESTVPEKSVKYLLLSILVPFANAICLFKCRNKGYSIMPMNYAVPTEYYPQNE